VREIEHIGNTAVPGLAGKPIIDLQAGIVKPSSVPVADAYSGRIRGPSQGWRAGTPILPPSPTACRGEPQHREGRSART
jgi:hypothetical protein